MIEKNILQVGMILYERWGYNQTNIDFYQIIKMTEKSIWLKELKSLDTPYFPFKGDWTRTTEPIRNCFVDSEKSFRRAKKKQISVSGHGVLRLYDSEKVLTETSHC